MRMKSLASIPKEVVNLMHVGEPKGSGEPIAVSIARLTPWFARGVTCRFAVVSSRGS